MKRHALALFHFLFIVFKQKLNQIYIQWQQISSSPKNKQCTLSLFLAISFCINTSYAKNNPLQSFEASSFCRNAGCYKIATWKRHEHSLSLYKIKKDKSTELEIYSDQDRILGASYNTIMLDSWSDKYADAASFLNSIFAGIQFDQALIKKADQNANLSFPWKKKSIAHKLHQCIA